MGKPVQMKSISSKVLAISLVVAILFASACGAKMNDEEKSVLETQCNAYGGFNCQGMVMELSNSRCSLDESLLLLERMFVHRMWAEEAATGIKCLS